MECSVSVNEHSCHKGERIHSQITGKLRDGKPKKSDYRSTPRYISRFCCPEDRSNRFIEILVTRTKLHGVTNQNTAIFSVTLVRTPNKVHPRRDHKGPQVEKRYSYALSLTSALDGVGGQRHAPAALPPGKTRYPFYRRLGRPPGQSGRVWKILPPPGFDPRTVQPVASRYTVWAISGHRQNLKYHKVIIWFFF